MKTTMKLSYGTTVALEALVAFAKSNSAADLMWYICRVFGLPLPLKVAVALRILLLTTGGGFDKWNQRGLPKTCKSNSKQIKNGFIKKEANCLINCQCPSI